MQAAKALMSLCMCAGSSELSLLDNAVISTCAKISRIINLMLAIFLPFQPILVHDAN